MKTYSLLAGLIAGALACAPVAPQVTPTPERYAGLLEFPAPQIYSQWWANIERCSGLTGDLTQLRFYVAPRPVLTLATRGGLYAGLYYPEDKRIIFGLWEPGDSVVVEHEFLHAIMDFNGLRPPDGGHPLHFFRDLCGAVVGPLYGA
jgi:hypothetical protein